MPFQDLIDITSIPPLPATASRLLGMVVDPDVNIDALAGVIERDPPLTGRVLGIANSAFYSPNQPVLTVKSAIVTVLGLNTVRSLAVGMALSGTLSTADCPRFDLVRYWMMALGTADLASGLARASTLPGAPDPDEAYLTGLLHNIGELLLVYRWPREMEQVYSRLEHEHSAGQNDEERARIGTDRWEAGAFLVRHWALPERIAESIEQLGSPADTGTQLPMVGLIRAAQRWLVGAVAGRPDTLRVTGVDDTYCEYRSTAFLGRCEALHELARAMN